MTEYLREHPFLGASILPHPKKVRKTPRRERSRTAHVFPALSSLLPSLSLPLSLRAGHFP